MADIMLYCFMGTNVEELPWLNVPQRPNVAAWFDRMATRDSSDKMMTSFNARVEN